jgi:hypothetical protein
MFQVGMYQEGVSTKPLAAGPCLWHSSCAVFTPLAESNLMLGVGHAASAYQVAAYNSRTHDRPAPGSRRRCMPNFNPAKT